MGHIVEYLTSHPSRAAGRPFGQQAGARLRVARALRATALALACGSVGTALTGAPPALAQGTAAASAELGIQHALLVGIGQFERGFTPLEGPAHDVRALRAVLEGPMGVPPAHIESLVDAQATQANVRAAIDRLLQRSRPGDRVMVYFSTHGTSAGDGTARLNLLQGSGALVLYDADPQRPLETLLLGRSEDPERETLVKWLSPLDRAGRQVWLVLDSCFASNAARSIQGTQLPTRSVPLVLHAATADRLASNRQRAAALAGPPPYPFRNVVQLAAAAEGEEARDIPRRALGQFPTVDGQPKGALTDALLRVLQGQLPADANRDGALSLHEIHGAVYGFMAQRAYGHSPVRQPGVFEDAQGMLARPLVKSLGSPAALAGPEPAALPTLKLAVANEVPDALRRRLRALPAVELAADGAADLVVTTVPSGRIRLRTSGQDVLDEFNAPEEDRLLRRVAQESFAVRLRGWVQHTRRDLLPFDMVPTSRGTSRVVGDEVCFSVQPDRDGYWVLLHIDAQANLQFLLDGPPPAGAPSAGRVPWVKVGGGRPSSTSRFKVEPPLGMDRVFSLVFDDAPLFMQALMPVRGSVLPEAGGEALLQALRAQRGTFTASETFFRTFQPTEGTRVEPQGCR